MKKWSKEKKGGRKRRRTEQYFPLGFIMKVKWKIPMSQLIHILDSLFLWQIPPGPLLSSRDGHDWDAPRMKERQTHRLMGRLLENPQHPGGSVCLSYRVEQSRGYAYSSTRQLLPDNKGAEFTVYSWIKATSLAVSEGQQSSDSKYLGVGRVWRTFSVHHQSPHLGPPWHSYAYVNSTDSRRASSSLQTPARMTEKEKRLVLVHGFRGFSPWAASSITSGLGKAEHHGGRREERRRLFVSRWSGGKEEEDGVKDKTHLLSGALLQWPFSN